MTIRSRITKVTSQVSSVIRKWVCTVFHGGESRKQVWRSEEEGKSRIYFYCAVCDDFLGWRHVKSYEDPVLWPEDSEA